MTKKTTIASAAARCSRARRPSPVLPSARSAITGFPTIWAQNIKNITLRQFGTGVSNLNAIADQVQSRYRHHPIR